MNVDKYLETIDFDELKEICLSKSGASSEIYISLIYYMISGEIGHEITYQVKSGIKFNILPKLKPFINVSCDTINMLAFTQLPNSDIRKVKDKITAENYIKAFHFNTPLNEEAFEWSFKEIEKINILKEKDSLDNKIKSFRELTERNEGNDKFSENKEQDKNKIKI
jgi:hypothetical protein